MDVLQYIKKGSFLKFLYEYYDSMFDFIDDLPDVDPSVSTFPFTDLDLFLEVGCSIPSRLLEEAKELLKWDSNNEFDWIYFSDMLNNDLFSKN